MLFFARVLGGIIWIGAAIPAFAQPSPLEQRARTILSANCESCHGLARMSDLDLRGIDTILKGGKRGPALVPGKSSESLLYRAVAQTGDLKMPPGKPPLAAAD